MSEDARSIQFRQFAALLFDELHARFRGIDVGNKEYYAEKVTEYERIIAQRAYDLVCHALDASGYGAESVGDVSDMSEWPLRRERRDLPPPPQVDPKLIKKGYC